MFSTTFNKVLVISWWPVLLVVQGVNHYYISMKNFISEKMYLLHMDTTGGNE